MFIEKTSKDLNGLNPHELAKKPTGCNHEAYLQNKYELKFLGPCHHMNVTRPTLWIDRFIKTRVGLLNQ